MNCARFRFYLLRDLYCIVLCLGFLVLTCSAQTPARPQARPAARASGALAAQSTPAAQAQPKYKGIWERVNYGEDINLNSVYFVSAQTGWASGGGSGGGGTILNTQDGGEHWNVQWGDPHGTEDAPSHFFFLDATLGWACQGYDHLLHTTDGHTWVASGSMGHYANDYVFTSEKNGLFVSGSTDINRTTDGGRSWKVVNQCAAKIQVDGLPRNVSCNWEKLNFPTPTMGYAIAWIDQTSLAVLGKTSDGGATWTVKIFDDLAGGYPGDVFFQDANNGLMRKGNVYEGQLSKTTDGGATWTAGASPKGAILRFADPEVGWEFYGNELHFTTDGGQHWNSRAFKFPTEVTAFTLPRRDRAYVVGNHGMIYRYRVVPIEFTAAGALDAPAMPAYGGAIVPQLQQMQTQVTALQTQISTAAASGSSASGVPAGIASGTGAAPSGSNASSTSGFSQNAPASGGFAQNTSAQSGAGAAPAGQPAASGGFSQDSSSAGSFAQDPNAAAGGFAQDASAAPPSQFVQSCCASQIQSLQTTFTGVAQLVPNFSGQFRNLNLLFVGLNMLSDMMNRAKQMRDSMVALKKAPDAQTALAALTTLLTNVQGASQAITTQFSNLSAAPAFGSPAGVIGNQVSGAGAPPADSSSTPAAASAPDASGQPANQTTSGSQNSAGAAAGKALDKLKKKFPPF